MTKHTITTEEEMMALAAGLAKEVAHGSIILLHGDLGAGKTVFARGFINALCGGSEDVPSPTYTLVQTYESPRGEIFHFDLYRLEDPEEIWELGWEEAQNAFTTLVEWPERLGAYVLKKAIRINIQSDDDGARAVTIEGDEQ